MSNLSLVDSTQMVCIIFWGLINNHTDLKKKKRRKDSTKYISSLKINNKCKGYQPSVLRPVHHVLNVVSVGDKVDAQQARVAVGGVEGLEALAQAQLGRQSGQTAAEMLRATEVKGKNGQNGRH